MFGRRDCARRSKSNAPTISAPSPAISSSARSKTATTAESAPSVSTSARNTPMRAPSSPSASRKLV